jgi:hypothetical protein
VFLDADTDGTSDGTTITWTLPPLEACGVPGTPQCPLLTADLTVDPLTPNGTVIEARASAVDPGGSATSRITKTTVGTFRLRRFMLIYPNKEGRDRLIYKATFTLPPGATLDPPNEACRIQVDTSMGPTLDLGLNPGQLPPFSATTYQYKDRGPGLTRVKLRELGPSHYSFDVRARNMTLPPLQELTVTVTLTLGDDVLTQPISLLVKRAGRKFMGLK